MRLCNDAPFAVGVAAAYDTNPSGGRRAEGWFRVEANDCLEGAIHGVVGDRMSLAAFSGTWQWPAAGGDFTHCLHEDVGGVVMVPVTGWVSWPSGVKVASKVVVGLIETSWAVEA